METITSNNAISNLLRIPCRLCLRRSSKNTDVFTTLCHEIRLHDIIHKLFSFWIKPTDISTVICHKCFKVTKDFYDFFNTVQKVQLSLYKDSTYPLQNEENTISNILIENTSVFIKDDQCSNEYISKDSRFFQAGFLDECNYSTPESSIKTFKCESANNDAKPLNEIKNVECSPINTVFDNNDQSDTENILNSFSNSDNEPIIESKEVTLAKRKSLKLTKNKALKLSRKMKKRVLKKNVKKVDKSPKNLDSLLETDDISDELSTALKSNILLNSFPTEIIRNGNLTMKGPLLDQLISKFYNIQCELCSDKTKFETLSEMFKHYDLEHKTKGYLTCCNTRLYYRQRINMHMARHLQPSAFQCPVCKKALHHKRTLQLHLQTHLPESERSYKCDQCDRRYSYLSGLRNHKMTHIPVEQRLSYNCELCEKSFTSAPSYYNHVSAIHTSGKYLCSECGRGFQTKTSLRYHMQTHDPTGENKVQCKHCGFVCKNKITLKIHMKRHTIEPIQCTLCNYSTYRTQQLNNHMKVKHSDTKPYSCNVCGKQFKLKIVLKTHMAQHTGERKFTCTYCPKTFASSGNYYSHRKRMHSEQFLNDLNSKPKQYFSEENNVKKLDEKELNAVYEPQVMDLIRKQISQLKSRKHGKIKA